MCATFLHNFYKVSFAQAECKKEEKMTQHSMKEVLENGICPYFICGYCPYITFDNTVCFYYFISFFFILFFILINHT